MSYNPKTHHKTPQGLYFSQLDNDVTTHDSECRHRLTPPSDLTSTSQPPPPPQATTASKHLNLTISTPQKPKMRLAYTPNPPQPTPTTAPIITAIQARRHPSPLQPLDLTLLHSPPIASGWNAFLGAVRTQTSLPADLRELAICRVAVCNGAWYEWGHHASLAVAAGVGEGGMGVCRRVGGYGYVLSGDGVPEGLSERQWAVLVYTDEMTRNVSVGDGVFGWVKGLFSDTEVVEITATVSWTSLGGFG